jgi:glycosyltransferase involved in cell wall biosynthesis
VHVVSVAFGVNTTLGEVQLLRIAGRLPVAGFLDCATRQRPLYDFKMIFKTLEVIRRYRPAILHAHGYEAMLAAWACRVLTGVPVVYSAHNTMADELPTYNFIRPRRLAVLLAKVLDRCVPRLADRVVPHSGNLEEFLRQRNLLDRTEPVIKFGINLEDVPQGNSARVREEYGLGSDPVVLYAGVLNPFQRLDLLLEAMARLVQTVRNARLLVVRTLPGEKFVADLCEQIEKLGLKGHVVITRPQVLRSVQEILSACDVAVSPRTQEPGFPIKMLNAMAAGKACVMYASSSRDLRHKKDAYLVAPDTAEALADGLLEVLTNTGLREQLACQGHAYVRANHDRRLIAARLSDVYLRTVLGPVTSEATLSSPLPSRAEELPMPDDDLASEPLALATLPATGGNGAVPDAQPVAQPSD